MSKITEDELSGSLLDSIKNQKIKFNKSTVEVHSSVSNVNISIQEFNKNTDLLMVFKNSIYLEEGIDYTISNDSLSITSMDDNWSDSDITILFNFISIRGGSGINIGDGELTSIDGNIIEDGTVNEEKLSVLLQTKISSIGLQLEDIAQEIIPTYSNIESIHSRYGEEPTDYWLSIIKQIDKDGERLKLKRGFANDNENGQGVETARSFSKRHGCSFCFNAGIFNPPTSGIIGTSIKDGVIIKEDKTIWNKLIMAWDDNSNFKTYRSTVDAQTILDEGYDNALMGFIPLYENGVEVSQEIKDLYVPFLERHPRQIIAKFKNGDIGFLSTSGRKKNNLGFTCQECIELLKRYDLEFAYMLDGGGSTQHVINGVLQNDRFDNNGYSERQVTDFIFFEKNIAKEKPYISTLRQNYENGSVDRQLKDLVLDIVNNTDFIQGYIRLLGKDGFNFQGIESWEGEIKNTKLTLNKDNIMWYDYIRNKTIFKVENETGLISTNNGQIGNFLTYPKQVSNVDELTNSGRYYTLLNCVGVFDSTVSYILEHTALNTKDAYQIAYPFKIGSTYKTMRRRKLNNVWEQWSELI